MSENQEIKPLRLNLSQSKLKDLSEYAAGRKCGAALYFDELFKDEDEATSEAQQLGRYFEYLATGAKPRNGKLVLPGRNKPKKDGMLGEVSASFGYVEQQAKRFKEFMEQLGLVYAMEELPDGRKQRVVGKRYEIDFKDRKLVIVLDALMVATRDIHVKTFNSFNTPVGIVIKAGEYVINDLKCTSLLMDKYDVHGWHPDTLPEREITLIQATTYLYVWNQLFNEKAHFIWSVFSSKSDLKFSLLYANPQDTKLQEFPAFLEKALPLLYKLEKADLRPRPSYVNCSACKHVGMCRFATTEPELWEVNY